MNTTNKKKIRGWKRRVKQIEQWKQRYLQLDMDYIASYHRDYVKLWIDPFYRLERSNPPVWYVRLLLAAMMEVYHNWDQQMKQLNEPYDLNIWLYHPHFIHSQIVVACRNKLHFYDQTFERTATPIDLPQQYATIAGTGDFTWESCIDTHYESLLDLQHYIKLGLRQSEEIAKIQAKAYREEAITSHGQADTLYHIQLGHVWMGKRKESQKG
ncbi:hypothetical protein [Paenibacillus kandeliae]|uniref:hypothetical protein n=1 Tax=Paenibacillus kandeliae TaxID=3231269 RepID=UPI00345A62E2